MNVTINQNGAKADVKIVGRLDTTTTADFQQAIQVLMEGENPEITVDCSEMDYTSSQGLRSFLVLQKSVNARHGSLVLKDMQPQVKEVFDITGFSSIIKIL